MFAIFVLLGPPAGSLTFGVVVTIGSALFEPGAGPGLVFLFASVAFVVQAYVVGGIQAAITGLVAALVVWRKGAVSIWAPLAAALLAGAFSQHRADEGMAMSALMLFVHVFAAAVCWLIASMFLNRK